MSLSKAEAQERVVAELRKCRPAGSDYVIVVRHTRRAPFGWVFSGNSKRYLQTGDLRYALAGNGAIFVNGHDGAVEFCGSAYALEELLETYERKWGRVGDYVE